MNTRLTTKDNEERPELFVVAEKPSVATGFQLSRVTAFVLASDASIAFKVIAISVSAFFVLNIFV